MRGSGREAFARLSAPLAIGAIAIAGILAGGLAPSPLSAAPVALPDQAGWNDARQLIATPDGQDIAYVELGEDPETASGVPVMLIHGYTDNSRSWSLLAPALREALPKRRILALDLRGHGYSAKPACCYGIDSLAGDVGGLMAALNIEQADLVGHSLGSMTAAYLAATRPEKVRRVVLVSSATRLPAESAAWLWENVPALPDPIDPDSAFMRDWYANPTPVTEDFLSRERAESAALPREVWMGVLQSLSATDWSPLAPRITAPVAILWGDQDGLFGAQSQDELRRALPQARHQTFEGLGHNLFWEQPQRAAETISTFLTD